MKASSYYSKYFDTIFQGLKSIDSTELKQAATMVWSAHQSGKKVIVVGKGESCSSRFFQGC